MFWRHDWIDVEEQPAAEKKPLRSDRFVMFRPRPKISEPDPVMEARKLLAKYGVYRLTKSGLMVPYDFVEDDEPVEQPSGLPSVFVVKDGKKTPKLWEV